MTSINFAGSSVLNSTSFVGHAATGSRSEPSVRMGVRSDFSGLEAQVGGFERLVRDLADPDAWSASSARSSSTSVARVATSGVASPGEYSIEVTTLARRQITTSTVGYSNTTDTVADGGSISFTVDGQTTASISVSSATSLAEIRDQINDQNSGVVASITNDAVDNKLVLSSRETGLGHGFTINKSLTNSAGVALAFETGQSTISGNTQLARNATFVVDGRAANSDSNTVTIAGGVSSTLIGTGKTTLTVSADTAAIKKSLENFVSEFNVLDNALSELAAERTVVEPRTRVAAGTVLRTVRTGVRQALSARSEDSPGSLGDLGVRSGASGGLKLDAHKLDAALAASPSDVESLLRGKDGESGILTGLRDHLAQQTGSSGFLAVSPTAGRGRPAYASVAALDAIRQSKVNTISGIDRSIAELEKSYSLLVSLPKAS